MVLLSTATSQGHFTGKQHLLYSNSERPLKQINKAHWLYFLCIQ